MIILRRKTSLLFFGSFLFACVSNAQVTAPETLRPESTPTGNFFVPLIGFYPTSATTGDTVYLRLRLPASATSVKFGGVPAAFYTGGEYDALIRAVVDSGASGIISLVVATYTTSLPNFVFLPPTADRTVSLCGPTANSKLVSNLQGANYQWQLSTDSLNFYNLADSGWYTGSESSTLILTGVTNSANGFKFRCLTDSVPSKVFTLQFENIWLGGMSSTEGLPWNSAFYWSCGVAPDANTNVVINNGNINLTENTTIRSLTVGPGATVNVAPGVRLTVLQ